MITLDEFLTHFRHPLALLDGPHSILAANTPFYALHGSSAEPQRMIESFLKANPVIKDNVEKVCGTHGSFYLRDIDVKDQSGRIRPMDVEIFPVSREPRPALCLIFYDRSFGEKFEEHKKRVDRIHTLNTIASGLAHEIKNPLSGIRAASQMLAKALKNKDQREYAEIILQENIRVNRLISDLMNLTKPRKLSKKKCNINQILHQILLLQKQAAPSFIEWSETFDPSLPSIQGDSEALSQVFLNLIQNAWQAVAKKGRVGVHTRFVTDFHLKKKNKSRQVIGVAVEDTGCGLSEEDLERVFVPFFTTKSEGTGLGLTVCHQIIEDHGGDIQVQSTKGKGSRFWVYLPV